MTPRLAILLSAALAAWVFAGIFANGFAWDDGYLIVDNPAVHGFEHAADWFVEPWAAGAEGREQAQNALYWRPLAQLSYAVDWAIGGGAPWPFHATNILLHVLASALVALLALRWTGGSAWAALAAGLLFAAHPVHGEAVALATYRTTLLAAAAVLGGQALHRRGGKAGRVLVPLIYAAGLLAKEDAAVLPALLLVVDLADGRHRGPVRELVLPYIPLAAIGLAWIILHGMLTRPALLDYFAGATGGEIAITMLKVYALYARLLILPLGLTPFYDWTILPIATSFWDYEVLAGAALLGLTVAGFLVGLLRARRALVLCCGLYLVALLPYAHLVPFFDAAGERFLYVPSMAACLAVAFAVEAARRRSWRPRLVAALVGLTVAALSASTAARNPDFASTEAMLRATTESQPGSFNAHYELGRLLLKSDRPAEAVTHLELAWRMLPDLEAATLSLAQAYEKAGDTGKAARFLDAELARRGAAAPDSYRVFRARLPASSTL